MKRFLLVLAGLLTISTFAPGANAATRAKVGDMAPDFSLTTLDDRTVKLGELTAKERVVLIVLRGWPGYQCPACDAQVTSFVRQAAEFEAAGARVVFVYPGPSAALKAHAAEFRGMNGRTWPERFIFALDPDHKVVESYGIRWDEKGETAYPSTFIIDRKGTIRFAKISSGHGDRSKAAEMLEQLKSLK